MSVRKQLDFYFSNQNYYKDTFLRTTCEENNGIDIKTLLTFKRLSDLKCTEEDLKKAVEESKFSELEGETKIKKIKDESYNEYITRKHDDYMVVIDGLDQRLSFPEIEKEFQKYFSPLLIRMKRKGKKEFSGAVLVELDSLEEVEKVLKLEIPYFSKNEQVNEDQNEKHKDIQSNDNVDVEKTKEDTIKSDEKGAEKQKENLPEENEQKDEVTSTKKKAEQENTKKRKANNLVIKTKIEYQKSLQTANQNKNKKDNFFEVNKNKVYKFMIENEYSIKEIRDMVKNVAFVDLQNKVLRFKHPKDESEMTVNEDSKLKRLTDEEYKEYVDKIKFSKKKK